MTTLTAFPPGLAGTYLRDHADDITLCDVYDSAGAPIYHDLALHDHSEIAEVAEHVRQQPGAVLDLAAGSGRFTLPLAAAGADVTAVDLSEDMLSLLRDRLSRHHLAERCTVMQADMTRIDLGRRFRTVLLGTTSVSLVEPTERPNLYATIKSHLADDGQLLISVLDRGRPADSSDADEIVAQTVGASGRRYVFHDYWPPEAIARYVTIIPLDGARPRPVATGRVGTLSSSVLGAELSAAGFQLLEHRELGRAGARHQLSWMRWGVAR